jgi:hypothetical protein
VNRQRREEAKKLRKFARPARSAIRSPRGSHDRGQESKQSQRREAEEQAPEDKHELEAKVQEIETSGAELEKTRGTKTPVYTSQPCGAAVTTNSVIVGAN